VSEITVSFRPTLSVHLMMLSLTATRKLGKHAFWREFIMVGEQVRFRDGAAACHAQRGANRDQRGHDREDGAGAPPGASTY
jgi:uncharacterized paraquat-inducible protein A